jgi:hypothetical protein
VDDAYALGWGILKNPQAMVGAKAAHRHVDTKDVE